MKRTAFSLLAIFAAALIITRILSAAPSSPTGSGFTYQGFLRDNGVPVSGPYDFEFRLYDAVSGGAQIGSVVSLADVPVQDGLFTALLDFGSTPFTGEARWIEVRVRDGASTGAYTALSPRQPLSAVPYALYALNSPGSGGGNRVASGRVALTAPPSFASLQINQVVSMGSPFSQPPAVTLSMEGNAAGLTAPTLLATGTASFTPTLTIPATAPITVTAQGTGFVGEYTSLAQINGRPAIAYHDANGNLNYVRANDARGTSWPAPVPVALGGLVGLHTSLTVVNGNPAISYYDAGFLDLKYVRANDVNGASWGTPITVDGLGGVNVGQFTSLAVVNGNPAISYFNQSLGLLSYVRATDANGTGWGTPVTIGGGGVVGTYTSLAVVAGRPAISYYDNSLGYLKYVRANDATGASWGVGQPIDTNGGEYTSLRIVNGRPAIAYYDGGTGVLKYVRANDTTGTSWNSPVLPDPTAAYGSHTSLAVINGVPAISYYDDVNTRLFYIQSLDKDGGRWGSPVLLDGGGQSGQYTSLAEINGSPAVSYYDGFDEDLEFVYPAVLPGLTLNWIATGP